MHNCDIDGYSPSYSGMHGITANTMNIYLSSHAKPSFLKNNAGTENGAPYVATGVGSVYGQLEKVVKLDMKRT